VGRPSKGRLCSAGISFSCRTVATLPRWSPNRLPTGRPKGRSDKGHSALEGPRNRSHPRRPCLSVRGAARELKMNGRITDSGDPEVVPRIV
jgi:hypothetical protein